MGEQVNLLGRRSVGLVFLLWEAPTPWALPPGTVGAAPEGEQR